MNDKELTFNFWYYVEEDSGFIYSLSGRPYFLEGSDEEKVDVLKALSKTDHTLAERFSIPERFWVTVNNGEKVEYSHVQLLPALEFQLFEDLADSLVEDLPKIPRKIDGDLTFESHQVPDGVLCLYTALYEKEIGQVTASVK